MTASTQRTRQELERKIRIDVSYHLYGWLLERGYPGLAEDFLLIEIEHLEPRPKAKPQLIIRTLRQMREEFDSASGGSG